MTLNTLNARMAAREEALVTLMLMAGFRESGRPMTGSAIKAELAEMWVLVTGHTGCFNVGKSCSGSLPRREGPSFGFVALRALNLGVFTGKLKICSRVFKKSGLEFRFGHRMAANTITAELAKVDIRVTCHTVLGQASVGARRHHGVGFFGLHRIPVTVGTGRRLVFGLEKIWRGFVLEF
jgi:hypothetical protein